MEQEIEAAVPEATKKDIGKAFKTIVAVLQSEDGVSLPLLSYSKNASFCLCRALSLSLVAILSPSM